MANGVLTARLSAAMAAITATLSGTGSIVNADTALLETLGAQVATAKLAASEVLAFYDDAVTAAGALSNFVAGTPSKTMVANVNALLTATRGLNSAVDCANRLGRMARNLTVVTG